MLWAALMISAVGRERALNNFRAILTFIDQHEHKEQLCDLTLTGIARLDDTLQREVIRLITGMPGVSGALEAMLLFKALPSREHWERNLPSARPNPVHLMEAIGPVLWHQSPEATDCRWFRVMSQAVAGKLHIAPGLKLVDALLAYPDLPDADEGKSGIRAAEIGISNPPGEVDRTWSNLFWQESWENTPCIESVQRYSQPSVDPRVTRPAISLMREQLQEHWQHTHSTTAVDDKHDAVFGMAHYCLRILEEMMSIGIGSSVLGRLGLRTVFEVRVNLTYLLGQNDPELWKRWREYGAGQAKLSSLKFDDLIEPPKYIDIASIDQIASEDIWDEFLTVNIASWSGLDLRAISEKSGLKELYDQYYSWTSGYSHGMWGAVRESGFQVCSNPLHRFHRYPSRLYLRDTVDDVALLVDQVMQCVDDAYPPFGHRLLK